MAAEPWFETVRERGRLKVRPLGPTGWLATLLPLAAGIAIGIVLTQVLQPRHAGMTALVMVGPNAAALLVVTWLVRAKTRRS